MKTIEEIKDLMVGKSVITNLADSYVRGRIQEELNEVLLDASKTFDEFSSNCIVVFH